MVPMVMEFSFGQILIESALHSFMLQFLSSANSDQGAIKFGSLLLAESLGAMGVQFWQAISNCVIRERSLIMAWGGSAI